MKIHLFIEKNTNLNEKVIKDKFKIGYNFHKYNFSINNNDIIITKFDKNSFINKIKANLEITSIIIFSLLNMDHIEHIKFLLNKNNINTRTIYQLSSNDIINELYDYTKTILNNKKINIYTSRDLVDLDNSNEFIFSLFEKYHENNITVNFIKNSNKIKTFGIAAELPNYNKNILIFTYILAYNFLNDLYKKNGYAVWKDYMIICFNKKDEEIRKFYLPILKNTITAIGILYSTDKGKNWKILLENLQNFNDGDWIKCDKFIYSGYLLGI